MAVLRIITERLFLGLFWLARVGFLAQGLALCTALPGLAMARSQSAPQWFQVGLRSSLLIGATLFASGVLLTLVGRRWPAARADDEEAQHGSPWPAVLGLSLVALSQLAYTGAAGLFPLWREIARLLARIGFWEALRHSDPFAGVVVLPILVALLVPALEAATAFFLIAAPLAMLILLVARSRLFPKLFAMLVVCQAGLVLAGLLGADALSQLGTAAISAMAAAEDAEVKVVAEGLRRAQSVLVTTAAAFVLPMLGQVVWLPFVSSSRRVRAFFTAA
jgi:hypothetical protein